jgi:hypothetical protein
MILIDVDDDDDGGGGRGLQFVLQHVVGECYTYKPDVPLSVSPYPHMTRCCERKRRSCLGVGAGTS